MAYAGGGAGAAAAAAIANAIKASGAIVQVEARDFVRILERADAPAVVHATGAGFFTTNHKYLTAYKGLFFYTKSPERLRLPSDAELFEAKRIWIPG